MKEQMQLPDLGMNTEQRLKELERMAIALLQSWEPTDGSIYNLAFSGGKDSVVIKHLAILSGVKFKATYNITTIDPPELVRFIIERHPDVERLFPEAGNFFFLVGSGRGFPTRRQRWCCETYKHSKCKGHQILGVRAAESPRRAKLWSQVTPWYGGGICINPIVEWNDNDVWDYIRSRKIEYCRLYDEGFKRLGCIGCPMAGEDGRKKEFERWPRYKKLWELSFSRLWDKRAGGKDRYGREWMGSALFDSPEEMFSWWCSSSPLPKRDLLLLEFNPDEIEEMDNSPNDDECLGLN